MYLTIAVKTKSWENAIVSSLQQAAQWWRRAPCAPAGCAPPVSWWGELATAYFGLGKSAKIFEIPNSTLAELCTHTKQLDTGGQAMLSLVLLQSNTTDAEHALVKSLAGGWYNSLRVQGQTAYVARGGGDSAPAEGLSVQALALHVFALTKPTDPLVEKLANYVAGGPGAVTGDSHSRWYSYSRVDSAHAAFAIAAFDRALGSATPSLQVFVARGDGSSLFKANFAKGGAPAVAHSYDYPGAALHAKQLKFYALGTGEASVALSASFVPSQLFVKPVFFGLFVQKAVAIVSNDGTLTPCELSVSKPLEPGTVLRVTIQVTSADDQVFT